LKGTPLTTLNLLACSVQDLSPLEEMKLAEITLPVTVARGMNGLRQLKSLTVIHGMPAKEFWQKYDRGEFKQLKP
jgi:hypothetical protein